MAVSALAKKLRLQDVQRALVLNAPEGYLEALGELRKERYRRHIRRGTEHE